MKKKVALIFGITGQDGSYLADFLIKKKYLIHGVKRRSSSLNTNRLDHINDPKILLDDIIEIFEFVLHFPHRIEVISTRPDRI